MFPTLNYTVENAKNNIAEWKKLVEQHRLKGWTPREKNEGKENGISKKDINKNNNSLNGGNNINGSHLDNHNNNVTNLKGNNKIINHNNINNINANHSEDIKKSYTANWGKPKLITIKKHRSPAGTIFKSKKEKTQQFIKLGRAIISQRNN